MDESQINEYRQPWESDEHWTLRKEFIEKFGDDFPEDRLLCLAQVYSNVELLGCTYPAPVMQQINQLSKELQECKELRQKRKERAAVQFVKEKGKAPGNSRNSSDAFSQKRSKSGAPENFTRASNQESDGTSKKLKACDSKSPVDSSSNTCLNAVKRARHCYINVNEQSVSPKQPFQESTVSNANSEQNFSNSLMQNSDAPENSSVEMTLQLDTLPKTVKDNFVDILQFIKSSLAKDVAPLGILNNMAQKFGLNLECDVKILSSAPNPAHECCVKVNGVFISKSEGPTKKKARSDASKLAVDLLMRCPRTVKSQSSNDFNRSVAGSAIQSVTKQKFPERCSGLSQNSVSMETAFASVGKLKFNAPSGISRSSCGSLNPNFRKSELHQNAYLPFNHSHSVPCSQEVPVFYQNTFSTPVSSLDGSVMKQNAKRVSMPKQANVKNKRNINFSDSAPEFHVILDNSDITKSITATSIFTNSANFNRVPFQFEYENFISDSQLSVRVEIILNGTMFCSGTGETKQMAKEAASRTALDILQQTAYTVKVKDEHDGGFTVSRNQVFDTAEPINTIEENNVGCKMLKMMGWSGGGIGKVGNQGIEEPVKAVEKHKFGQGLGYTKKENSEVSFTARIEQILQDYARSDSTSDLIFSTEFSKDERKEIHRVASKYGLKNNSTGGKGDGRHLIVSRRYTAQQLINRLKQCGGRTHKYELIEPTGCCNPSIKK